MFGIRFDPASYLSITAQLCQQVRQNNENGEFGDGLRLPPTRKLAAEFGIARNVFIDAYEQLIAEGYLIGQAGSGTYVAGGIQQSPAGAVDEKQLDVEGLTEDSTPPLPEGLIDFEIGTPDLRQFPRQLWAKYLKEAAEMMPSASFDYGDIRGEKTLRLEISAYLHRTRGMRCHPAQIMIVSGSSEGFTLIAQALRDSFDGVYLEDPTIEFTQHIFRRAGYRISPVAVDGTGMKLHELPAWEPGHLMLLTPSHQFPGGGILSIQRRQQAIRLAEEAGAYLIEDDYDGDFRLKGVPIPPLQALSPDRVIYVGTFSKTLAPGLRLGFLVLPRHLVNPVADLRESLNLRTPSIPQVALARFMQDGRLDRHIHKMKKLYRQRRQLLIEALKQHFGDRVLVQGDEAGMHLQVQIAGLPVGIDWSNAQAHGVRVYSVEDYCLVKGNYTRHILLGYGNLPEENIEPGIARLRRFIEETAAGASFQLPN
ncbi:HTH-type transcriptional regulatory protein GabR [compost metagenome]